MVIPSEQQYFQARAREMAHSQAQAFLKQIDHLTPNTTVPHLVSLIQDCIYHLGLPALALELTQQFQPRIEQWSTWSSWQPALDAALAVTSGQQDQALHIQFLLDGSQAAREIGNYTRAQELAATALRLATASQQVALVAKAYNKLGVLAYRRQELEEARQLWEAAYHIGMHQLEAREQSQIALNIGLVALDQAALPVATVWLERAQAHAEIADDSILVAKVKGNQARLAYSEGRITDAVALWHAVVPVFHESNSRYAEAMTHNSLGCGYLRRAQFDVAETELLQAVAQFHQLGALAGKALALSNLGELYVTRAQYQLAEHTLAEAWQLAERTLAEAWQLAEITEQPLLVAAIEVDQGRLCAAQGNTVRACQLWQQALAVQRAAGLVDAAHWTEQLLSDSDG